MPSSRRISQSPRWCTWRPRGLRFSRGSASAGEPFRRPRSRRLNHVVRPGDPGNTPFIGERSGRWSRPLNLNRSVTHDEASKGFYAAEEDEMPPLLFFSVMLGMLASIQNPYRVVTRIPVSTELTRQSSCSVFGRRLNGGEVNTIPLSWPILVPGPVSLSTL